MPTPPFQSKKETQRSVLFVLFLFYCLPILFVLFFCVVLWLQVCWYFPLKNQLATLLRNKKYRKLLMHETRRASNPAFMSDVYDTPRWKKEVAGPPTKRLTRIVYQVCVDGFPWSKRKHLVVYIFFLLVVFLLVAFPIVNNLESQPSTISNPNRQQFQIPTVNNLNPNRQQFESQPSTI